MSRRLSRWDRWKGGTKAAAQIATLAVVTFGMLPLEAAVAVDAATPLTLDIGSQSLETALLELSKQGRLQLVIAADTLPPRRSAALHGRMSLGTALDRLLEGTGLTYRLVGEHTIAIVKATGTRPSDPPLSPEGAGELSSASPTRGSRVAGDAKTNMGDQTVKHRNPLVRLATFLGICVSTGAVCAQDVGTYQLEEIVVTARKREESLQNVPAAVAVVAQEQLRNNLAHDLTKVGELAPQVSMSQGGSGTGAIITVRGVSSASNDAGLDQSVAIEVDGVPISRGQVISASIFDLQQIQVLQGPQALFFGKNSPAGVISLTSANPTDTFEAYITPGFEFEANQKYLEGAVSGPITDTFKVRLAFRGSEMDGWLRNVAEPVQDIINPAITIPGATMGRWGPDDQIYAGRLTLLWEPSENFDANLKITANSQERNAGNASTEPFCVGGQTEPVLLGAVPLPGADCWRNKQKAHSSVAPEYAVNFPYGNGGVPYMDSRFVLAALNLNWRFDAFSLTSTTGYYDQTVQQMSVSDWSPFATIWAASKETYELVTQELRLNSDFDGPVNFMAGVYYEDFTRPFFNSADLFHAFNPVAQNYATVSLDSKTKGDYFSVFGQVRWNILPELELAAGARYSRDKKESRLINVAVAPSPTGATLLPAGQPLFSKYDDDNVSPEATLTWRPTDDHTFYVAYKTGYKAGGISNPFLLAANATPRNIQFEPEEAKGFEAGYKAQLLDRTLRLDLVGYRYDYEDLQVVSYNAETISFTINNAAEAKIEGVQGSFEWSVLDTLTLRGNIGWNRARYESFPNAQCYPGQTAATGCVGGVQDLAGKDLLRAPEVTFSLGANFSPRIVNGWDTTLSIQGTHSDAFQTATDYAPGGFQEAFWLLNAALRVGPDDGSYEVALIGRNLTDTYYMLNVNGWSGANNPNQFVGFFNRPREVVLQGTVRFGNR